MRLDESAHLVAQLVNVRFLDEPLDLLELLGREIFEAGHSACLLSGARAL